MARIECDVSGWEEGVIVSASCSSVDDADLLCDGASASAGGTVSHLSDIFAVFASDRCTSGDVRDAFRRLNETFKAGW